MSKSPCPTIAQLCLSTGLCLAAPAMAQEKAGLYANLYLGSSSLSSNTLSESRPALALLSGSASYGNGLGAGGALGYRYGNGWAAELAWDYRRHNLKRVGGVATGGDFASNTYFVNGYYRFAKTGMVRPFVGLGLGWTQEIDIDIERGGQQLSYSRSGSTALQAIVGAEYELSERWSLVGDLRWMRVGPGSFKPENAAAGGALLNQPRYQPVSLHVGLTYRF